MNELCAGEDDLLGEGEGAGRDLSEEAGQDQGGGAKSNCSLVISVKRGNKTKEDSNPTTA